VAAADAFFVAEDDTLTVAAPGVLANRRRRGRREPAGTTDRRSHARHGDTECRRQLHVHAGSELQRSDLFTYKANDGTRTQTWRTVSITIEPVNDAPVAVNDSYGAMEDTPLTVGASGVLANDTDVDGDPLTAIVAASPANGR